MNVPLLEQLREAFDPRPEVLNGPGIYALWDDTEIVYIGKSNKISRRVKSHARDVNKAFLKFSAVPVPEEELNESEDWLIARVRPRFNESFSQRHLGLFPRVCQLCHELTDDEYSLSSPRGTICPGCRNEWQLFAVLRAFGCLTDDGDLTGELDVILKRHFKRRYQKSEAG